MSKGKITRWGLRGVVLLAASATGAAAAAWVMSPATPEQLRLSEVNPFSPVSVRTVDDARSVELSFSLETPTPLVAPIAGMVTASECLPGVSLNSGESHLSIDGNAVISLATKVPLWRDLSVGDKGDDVAALQTELARLGYSIASDGEVGPRTLASVADLLGLSQREAKNYSVIHASSFLWLPASQVTVNTCLASIGKRVELGEDLLTLTDSLTGARIALLPHNLVPGERILIVDDQEIPVNDDGTVTEVHALATLQTTSSFSHWREHPDLDQAVHARFILAQPVEAYSLAPASIYAMNGAEGCVLAATEARPVTVLSSELGQTIVSFDDGIAAPSSVAVSPREVAPCR